MIVFKNDVRIREMLDSEDDYSLMLKWLSNPKLLEFYEGRDKKFTLESVKEKYQPRILGKEEVIPFIATLSDNTPIGYLQAYELGDEQKEKFGLSLDSQSFGVDLFIGEPEYWGKGLGTKLLSLLIKHLFEELNADSVIIDPRVENERAIRSYEKVGFKKIKVLKNHELHEGKYHDNWLMIINRQGFEPK